MDPVGAETLGGSTACGSSFPFVEPGSGAVSQHVHKVVLRSLVPGERYRYRCGSAASGGGDGCGWSAWRSFTAKRRHLSSSSGGGSGSQQHSAQLLVVGDMGALNARCLPDLVGEVQGDGDLDLLVGVDAVKVEVGRHVGDRVHVDRLGDHRLGLGAVLQGHQVAQELAGVERLAELVGVHRQRHRAARSAVEDAGYFAVTTGFASAARSGAVAQFNIKDDLGHDGLPKQVRRALN